MIHVCFGIHDADGRYSKLTGTTMLSMFENTSYPPPSLTVHIFHDNTLTQDNRDKFNLVAGRYGQIIKFYNVEKLCADKIAEMIRLIPSVKTSRVSVGAFFRLLISQVLPPEIEKVIYLDSDLIVNLDIAELWRVDPGDKILACVTTKTFGGKINDTLCRDGLVKEEDYFSSGVLVMNLKALRDEEETLWRGIKFRGTYTKTKLFDQNILNYCFSTRTLKLPAKFNKYVWVARKDGETFAAQKIYHYTWITLGMDTRDPFNRLWMDYFVKTPWFDVATIDHLYESIRRLYVDSKQSLLNISAAQAGKIRVFVTTEQNISATKEIFSVHGDDEIISVDLKNAVSKILDAMKRARGKKFFFVLLPDFPFEALTQAGFVYGIDFMNGLEFLSEAQGMSLNSHPLIKAM